MTSNNNNDRMNNNVVGNSNNIVVGSKKLGGGGGSYKTRFDGLDVTCMVSHLQQTLSTGRRVVNIYDGDNGDTYILKLEKGGGSSGSSGGNNDNNSNKNNNKKDGSGGVDVDDDDHVDVDVDVDDDPKNSSSSLTTSSSSSSSSRDFLLLESGVRFHTLNRSGFTSSSSWGGNSSSGGSSGNIMPSPFCSKLRKHIRGLRLENIQQLGYYDRVIMIQFGSNRKQKCFIVLELYARGNLLLLDANYTILALLRSHTYNKNNNTSINRDSSNKNNDNKNTGSNTTDTTTNVQVKVGHVYPVTYATTWKKTATTTKTTTTITTNADATITTTNDDSTTTTQDVSNNNHDIDHNNDNDDDGFFTSSSIDDMVHHIQQFVAALPNQNDDKHDNHDNKNNNQKNNKSKKKADANHGGPSSLTLKTLLLKSNSGLSHYGPALIEHCILTAGFDPHISLVKLHRQLQHQHQPQQQQQPSKQQHQQNQTFTNENKHKDKDIFFAFLQRDEWIHLRRVVLHEGRTVLNALRNINTNHHPGYILYRPNIIAMASANDQHGNDKQQQQQQQTTTTTQTTTATTTMMSSSLPHADKILHEYHPYLFRQYQKQHNYDANGVTKNQYEILSYQNFSDAVDEYYHHMISQRKLIKAIAAENNAIKKLQKVHDDQIQRIQQLELDRDQLKQLAEIVQYNADNVDKAILVINSALNSGMDWNQLQQLVYVEKYHNHNPIAMLIETLHLDQDTMTLKLPTITATSGTTKTIKNSDDDDDDSNNDNSDVDDDENDQVIQYVHVKISLKDTAHGNSSQLFAKYRMAKEKSQKTIDSIKKAMKASAASQEQNAKNNSVKNIASTHMLLPFKRHIGWYEKFYWFITSDNYLVIGGRDSHQNELLVKRYLRKNDLYFHADIPGASSCILRSKKIKHGKQKITVATGKDNNDKSKTTNNATTTVSVPISARAIHEAGYYTICRSNAWSRKIITSSWYVHADQVSKTAPTGEYLTTGAFMIRGKKNYIQPTSSSGGGGSGNSGQLEMGIGILFRIDSSDKETVERHRHERRDFALMEFEQKILQDQQQEDDDADDDRGAANVDNSDDVQGRVEKEGGGRRVDEEEQHVDEGETAAIDDNQTRISEDQDGVDDDEEDMDEGEKGDDNDNNSNNIKNDNNHAENEQLKSRHLSAAERNQEEGQDTGSTKDGVSEVVKEDAVSVTPKGVSPGGEQQQQQEQQHQEQQQQRHKKRGVSARDRKLIKKYGSIEEAERVLAAREAEATAAAMGQQDKTNSTSDLQSMISAATSISASAASSSTNKGKPKRGQKSKMKRAMKKYSDQDDDDRELAMLALQGNGENNNNKTGKNSVGKKGGGRQKNHKKTEMELAAAAETTALLVKDSSKVVSKLPNVVQSILARCIIDGNYDADADAVEYDEEDMKSNDGTIDNAVTAKESQHIDWNGVLEQLASLQPEAAQIAAVTRLRQLHKSKSIDDFSSSLAGILRTIRKYGYQNILRGNVDDDNNDDDQINHQKDASHHGSVNIDNDSSAFASAITDYKEDDENDDNDDVVDDTDELNKLTGKPHPDDVLLNAVVVCAPYQTISQYTYRIKLTPGSMKRGKAAKQCLEVLLKDSGNPTTSTKQSNNISTTTATSSGGRDRQRALIKNVLDNDWVQVMPPDVKISAAGAGKLTAATASKKKQKKK